MDFTSARDRMVDAQIAGRGVHDLRVLAAMRRVPREAFVGPGSEASAYRDAPLPIGEGQTISQPYIVAVMIEAAAVKPGDRVLEIGAGSGYAAAVLAEIGGHVHAMERLASLAQAARQRLAALGYAVELRVGDGTLGWPEAAPFDAILVAAGGPNVPEPLKQQLAVGGRLVIPVGARDAHQTLLKITRRSGGDFEEEDLGPVMFVPLVGAGGWDGETWDGEIWEGEARQIADDGEAGRTGMPVYHRRSLPQMIAGAAEPLPDFADPAFGRLFDRFGEQRVVLLGEASHGTAEFYRARAVITQHLVEHHGFTIVAVEADWPDAAAIDRHVRRRTVPASGEPPFRRFPTWMWRNTEVAAFVDWLHRHNAGVAEDRRAAFHGLDIYSLGSSIAAVLAYLDKVDPAAARIARERYGCLTPWQNDPSTYGRAVLTGGYRQCEEAVVAQCRDLLQRRLDAGDGESLLDAAQNARLIAAAERYYRVMYYGGAESWNLRDTHMFETLEHLLQWHGPKAKAIVWAHNSHIGDARFTDMGQVRDELNLGQLCRQQFGDAAALVGFGTHAGTVGAATDWGGDMEIKRVRPALPDSYEHLCHEAGPRRFLLDLAADGDLRAPLLDERLERFIGVIYRPETERLSHYAAASLPQQFDAWVWFDETSAVVPLGPEHARPGGAETWPFGL